MLKIIKKLIPPAFLMLSVLMIFIGADHFNSSVRDELSDSVNQTLTEATTQIQTSIQSVIDSKTLQILSLSDAMTSMINDEDLIYDYLPKALERANYENIMFTDTDGQGTFADKTSVNISDTDYFKAAMAGQVYVTDAFVSEYTQSTVFVVSAPVYYQSDIVGVIAGSYTLEYLESLFLTFSMEEGNSYIFDRDGNVIMSDVVAASGDSGNMLSTTSLNSDQKARLLNDFANRTPGLFTYTLNDETRMAAYAPLEINNWMVLYSVSEAALSQQQNAILQSMMIFTLITALIFLVVLLYLAYTRKQHLKSVEKAAYYDELTGLPNMVRFKQLMRQHLDAFDGPFSIVKFDIANFKVINELFSFETGNKVLCAFAQTGARVEDPSYFIARTGSDEFFMFSGNGLLHGLETSRLSYEPFFKTLVPELKNHNLTFRYGRYKIESIEEDVNDIVNKATMAHNYAKTQSGDRVIFDYDDSFKQKALITAELSNKMYDAIANEDFVPYLQPKFNIENNELIGAEALVRWIERDGNIIYPNVFIPLFESNGFIVELDKHMLKIVCRTIKRWIANGYNVVPVSVNFSRIHLQNPQFVADLKAIVDDYELSTSYIEIELTETTVTENEGDISDLLEKFRDAGFTVSIDDFGAGYSSLGMLKNFTVDTLKLDRSFFDLNKYDKRGDLVIDGIIRLAHSLDMRIVAEGVEAPDQVDFLKSVNCESAQGYYFAKPMPIVDFEKRYYLERITDNN